VPYFELTAKKWLDSIEKQRRRSNVRGMTEGQTDRETESIVENSRLLAAARRGDQQ